MLEADRRARVVIVPSDHYVACPSALDAAINAAAAETSRVPLILVGAEPTHAETEYGWIEPGEIASGGVPRIVRFVEKPSSERARELFENGCLWNTFVMVADGARIWRIAEERMPVAAAVIRAGVAANGSKGPCLARAYGDMESVNFSRTVLEQVPGLGVVSARGCGFSDWGSPDRVLASLRGTADYERLLPRIGTARVTQRVTLPRPEAVVTLSSRSDKTGAQTSPLEGLQL